MGSLTLNMARFMFESDLVSQTSGFMKTLLDAISSIVNQDFCLIALTIMGGIAASLLIIYFFIDLAGQASKDMFSLEKFVLAFCKLIIAIAILMYTPEIVAGIVDVGKTMYNWVADSNGTFVKKLINTKNGETIKYRYEEGGQLYDKLPGSSKADEIWGFSLSKILDQLQTLFVSLLTSIIGFIAKVVVYFVAISNALNIIVRSIFSPIAVVRLFEDGSKSQGIKYLKDFFSECMQMAVIVVVLYACSKLTSEIQMTLYKKAGSSLVSTEGGKTVINLFKFQQSLTLGNLHLFLLPQLATVGATLGAGKLSKEIFG